MNRIKMFALAALLFCLAIPASAQTRGIGFGGYLQAGNAGEDGGLTAKMFLNDKTAIEIYLSIENDPFGDSMGAYASYLFHHWNVIPVNAGKLPLYWGPNAGIGVWDGGSALRFGMIGGLSYCLPAGTAPMDFFLQLNPTFQYFSFEGDHNDKLELDMFLQLGLRFFI
jgi:hypothetical protein